MVLNRDRIGHAYPSYRYEVSREKIREYARALGEEDPRHLSDGDDCVAPPTFAACFTITRPGEVVFADPDLGFHPILVHGSQAFVFGSRPLQPGDVLTCTPTITGITYRGGNEFMTMAVDCRHQDGGLAVRAENTIVFFGSAPDDPDAATPARGGRDAAPVPERGAGVREAAVGDVLDPVVVTHGLAQSVAYAGASGDLNPLHYDPAFASTVPPAHDVIAHGMYSMGLASRALAAFAGGAEHVHDLRVRFTRPWVTGRTATFGGRVTGVEDGAATVSLTGTDDEGDVLLRGTGTVAVAG